MPGARSKGLSATFIDAMKARNAAEIPGGNWRCEIKFDGYRAIAVVNRGEVQLWSRNRQSLTADYPEIVAALGRLKCRDATLDGEIVAVDTAGRSRFALLQARNEPGADRPIVYYLFDLMHRDGKSLVNTPLEERRRQLVALVRRPSRPLQFSPVFDVAPAELLAAARRQGLEGIVAKRRDSLYEAGRRSGAWLKCKIVAEQEFVIGGFTPPKNTRAWFGALVVGYYQGGKLMYAGKVGTGFDRARLQSLHAMFALRVRRKCPFANLPMPHAPRFGTGLTRAAMNQVTWIKPELVAQVKFAEWTRDGLLRQPVFIGLRADKPATEVRRELAPASARRA